MRGDADQFVEPVGGDDFDVVVQQAEKFARCLSGRTVVERGKIERRVVTNDADIGARDLREIVERLLFRASSCSFQTLNLHPATRPRAILQEREAMNLLNSDLGCRICADA